MSAQVLAMSNSTCTFQFEKDFDPVSTRSWFISNWTSSFYFVAVYLFFIYFGSRWMAKRSSRFEIQGPLVLWNLGLALFSIFGSFRSLEELLFVLNQSDGFHHSVCVPSWGQNNAVQFWTFLFIASKAVELGDTVFIVLRKQPLIFLHWYHHITVLVYAWYTYAEFTAPTRWFVTINFMVHSVMYSYYGLKALKVWIPKPVSVAITSLQIVQMVVGMGINVYAFKIKTSGDQCHVGFPNIFVSLSMYASYFVLFGQFFYKAYVVKRPRQGEMKSRKSKLN